MNALMLGFLAETPIHPGTGRSMGVVDLPVAREAATDYPVLVGSSLKGALRDHAHGRDEPKLDQLFGKEDHAGQLLVSDARLLLLPVRCLTGAFRWVTCPHLLERYRRDRLRAGLPASFDVPKLSPPKDGTRPALGADKETIFLEEREFEVLDKPNKAIIDAIAELLLHDKSRERLNNQLVILHDDDFAWFARYGLPIQARNKLETDTKQSVSLWYEETLPPESVMYSLILGREAAALDQLDAMFPDDAPYLQAGGNATVGQGWFAVTVLAAKRGAR